MPTNPATITSGESASALFAFFLFWPVCVANPPQKEGHDVFVPLRTPYGDTPGDSFRSDGNSKLRNPDWQSRQTYFSL